MCILLATMSDNEQNMKLTYLLAAVTERFDFIANTADALDKKIATLFTAHCILILGNIIAIIGAGLIEKLVLLFSFILVGSALLYLGDSLIVKGNAIPDTKKLKEDIGETTPNDMLKQMISNTQDATEKNKVILKNKVYAYKGGMVLFVPAAILLTVVSLFT